MQSDANQQGVRCAGLRSLTMLLAAKARLCKCLKDQDMMDWK